jgi:hypothetical protein
MALHCLRCVHKFNDKMHEKYIILRFEIVVFSAMGPCSLNGWHRRFILDLLFPLSDGLPRQTQNFPPKYL